MLPLKLACKKERERERERGRGQERKKEGKQKVLVYSKFFLACVMKLFVIVASV